MQLDHTMFFGGVTYVQLVTCLETTYYISSVKNILDANILTSNLVYRIHCLRMSAIDLLYMRSTLILFLH
jgi:hypothetical protein